jgi:hypothetical protein
MIRSSLLVALGAALLSASACGRGGQAADETQPAGTQPAPTTQDQAAPQTGPNTPQSTAAQAPQPSGPVPGARSYASCMADAREKGEGEREVLERTCASLPDAPRR